MNSEEETSVEMQEEKGLSEKNENEATSENGNFTVLRQR